VFKYFDFITSFNVDFIFSTFLTTGSVFSLQAIPHCSDIIFATSFFNGNASFELQIFVNIVCKSIVHLFHKSNQGFALSVNSVSFFHPVVNNLYNQGLSLCIFDNCKLSNSSGLKSLTFVFRLIQALPAMLFAYSGQLEVQTQLCNI
jgi:hypothetical protein